MTEKVKEKALYRRKTLADVRPLSPSSPSLAFLGGDGEAPPSVPPTVLLYLVPKDIQLPR